MASVAGDQGDALQVLAGKLLLTSFYCVVQRFNKHRNAIQS